MRNPTPGAPLDVVIIGAGQASVPFLHASNWLDQDELPRHVLFAGGGYRDIAERLQHMLESGGNPVPP